MAGPISIQGCESAVSRPAVPDRHLGVAGAPEANPAGADVAQGRVVDDESAVTLVGHLEAIDAQPAAVLDLDHADFIRAVAVRPLGGKVQNAGGGPRATVDD